METFDVSKDFEFDKIIGENKSSSPADIDENLMARVDAKQQKKMENEIVKSIVKEPKNSEETKRNQELVLHLVRYGNSKRFSEYLKSLGFQLTSSYLKKYSSAELEEILLRVQTSLDNKSVSNFWSELALGGIQTTEAIVSSTKLGEKIKIQGLTDCLRGNDDFLDLLEMLELSYANFTHIRPEIRLVYTILSSGLKVHSVNSFMDKRKKMLEPKQEEIKPEEKQVEQKEETKEEQKESKEEEQILTFD